MDDQQLNQIIADYSATYEKSIKNLIDFLRGANTMIGWLVALSSGTIIFGFKETWSKNPEYLVYASFIHAAQILCAALHRIYNDSHISSLNERIDYVNLQKTFLQNDTSYVRNYPNDKIFFEVYNKIGNLHYLNDIEMTGLQKIKSNLKITKRIYATCGVLVILTFIAIYSLFIRLLLR